MRFASSRNVVAIGGALLLSGCNFGVLTPAGPVGSADATIMLVVVPRIERAGEL